MKPIDMIPTMIMPNMVPVIVDIDDTEDERQKKDDFEKGMVNEVDRILNKIEKNNPEIFVLLKMYNMPYPVARRLVRRIIRLTLQYQK
ncbi:hypothetical protein [Thermobrachium celere]|uniref:Uncharacterized protein n=1 Tax=Thermobrachium celere DSM 8682 TaxID=941824 RepID=R7RN30_9CLOT|nr:hypothetical protein [Thermobrachium celere]GFR35410.1 hypothetical protein TCEA9_12220 [Thermobrachium celere]CDF57567.1 hypothetical protein TCEL_01481 [Thermobrachium celere DSM 8682]